MLSIDAAKYKSPEGGYAASFAKYGLGGLIRDILISDASDI
jgi:hypothetical protein